MATPLRPGIWPRKRRALTDAAADEAERRYRSGETGPAIAAALGVNSTRVYDTLRRRGVDRRPRGRAPAAGRSAPAPAPAPGGDPATLGGLMRAARRGLGLSIRDMEPRCGLSNAYLALAERGRIRNPGVLTLAAIAAGYGIAMGDLVDAVLRAARPAGEE